jgi:hypothetical protein
MPVQKQQHLLRHKEYKYSMLLNEFFQFNDSSNDFAQDRRYDSRRDSSVMKKSDTRKIRLTLRQINQLRMQSEAHEMEHESELSFVRQMYGQPPAEAPAA